MTEDEARKKWCPMVRYAQYFNDIENNRGAFSRNEGVMQFKYMFEEGDKNYPMECASCGCVAPLTKTKRRSSRAKEPEWCLCEICSGSFVGNASDYHELNRDILQTMAQIGNIILDKLTDRTKELDS